MTIQEIERAIDALTPQEIDELYRWLDERYPQLIDAELEAPEANNHGERSRDQRTGVDLIKALQSSPCREQDIEPTRFRSLIPARDVTF